MSRHGHPTQTRIRRRERGLDIKPKQIARTTVEIGGRGKKQSGIGIGKTNKRCLINHRGAIVAIQDTPGQVGYFKKSHLGPIGYMATDDQTRCGLYIFVGGCSGDRRGVGHGCDGQ